MNGNTRIHLQHFHTSNTSIAFARQIQKRPALQVMETMKANVEKVRELLVGAIGKIKQQDWTQTLQENESMAKVSRLDH